MVHIVQKVRNCPKYPNGPKWSYEFLQKKFQKGTFCLGHIVKELCSPEDCDRSGGGRWALERPLRLGLGLRDKLNIIRKINQNIYLWVTC